MDVFCIPFFFCFLFCLLSQLSVVLCILSLSLSLSLLPMYITNDDFVYVSRLLGFDALQASERGKQERRKMEGKKIVLFLLLCLSVS